MQLNKFGGEHGIWRYLKISVWWRWDSNACRPLSSATAGNGNETLEHKLQAWVGDEDVNTIVPIQWLKLWVCIESPRRSMQIEKRLKCPSLICWSLDFSCISYIKISCMYQGLIKLWLTHWINIYKVTEYQFFVLGSIGNRKEEDKISPL